MWNFPFHTSGEIIVQFEVTDKGQCGEVGGFVVVRWVFFVLFVVVVFCGGGQFFNFLPH